MDQALTPGRSLHPLRSLGRHWRISAVLALLVIVGGVPVAWIKGTSQYVAESVFQVSPNFQKNLAVDKELELQSNSQYREFVNHLSRSVLRYDTLQAALANLRNAQVSACLPAETERRCIERYQRAIYVIAINDTYMVKVGLASTDRKTVDKVVNAIMDVFIRTTRTEQIFGSDERSRIMEDRRAQLLREIADLSRQRDAYAARLGLATFGENTSNPYDLMLAQARERHALATNERSQAQAALDAFKAQRETPLSAGRSVLEMRLQDTGLQALRNEVIKRSEELLRIVSGLEARHPAREPAIREKDELETRLQSRETAFEHGTMQNVQARLTATLLQTQQVERDTRERLREMEGQAQTYAANFREAMRLAADMRKRDQELNELRDRLNYLSSERQAIGFVRLVTPALPADIPQGIGRTRLLLAVFAGAALLFLVFPTVVDLLDRRVLAPRDAERALGIGAAGWIVNREDMPTEIQATDQTRRLATMMLRQCKRGPRKVFGFTSARVGGGTTHLVHDLARVLVELGNRALIVDANTLARRAGGTPEGISAGGLTLADLLAGRADAVSVIHHVQDQGVQLALVPRGDTPERGIERLDRLRDALDRWSRDWDIVLIDIPPLLPSADAELLIDTLGQVFLVVEAGTVPKSDVALAKAALQRLDPEAVGLIVTRVSADDLATGLKSHLIENITGSPIRKVESMQWFSLQWELLRARVARWRSR